MEAVVIEEQSVLRVVDHPRRKPEPHEVSISVELIGICATDLHIMDGHLPTARYPIVPGHEVTGTVVDVGDAVTTLISGTRVVIDPGLPCMLCGLCREGRPNLCENRNAVGITQDGGAAEFLTLPAANCHRIAKTTPAHAAVLTEPLACVLHAFDLIRSPAGQDVLIYGAGTVGLLAVHVARHLGAATVSVVELNHLRAELALRAGADKSACSANDFTDSNNGWQLVIDATGAPAAIADGLNRVRRGGTYLQIGVAPPEFMVPLSPYAMFARELTIVGSMTTRNTFPRAIKLLDAGVIKSALFTGIPFPLSEYAKAIDSARRGDMPKVIVDPRR